MGQESIFIRAFSGVSDVQKAKQNCIEGSNYLMKDCFKRWTLRPCQC